MRRVAAPLHRYVRALEMGAIILVEICAVHESAFGTKRTSHSCRRMSAFGGKADIAQTPENCPLMTQSGHCTIPNQRCTKMRS